MRKHLANIITSSRIIAGIALLFIEPFTALFYYVYIIGASTDAFDGYVARKFNSVSVLGSKLDTVADLTFYGILFIKTLYTMCKALPGIFNAFIIFAFALRFVIYAYVFIKYKKLASTHSMYNKISSASIFGLPIFFPTKFFTYYALIVVVLAIIAAFNDLVYYIKYNE